MKIPKFRTKPSPTIQSKLLRLINEGALTQGDEVREFESKLASVLGQPYALGCSNGFSAMVLAIQALRLEGKSIAVPALSSCLSFINAIRVTGNRPVLVDIDIETATISPIHLKEIMQSQQITAVIVPSHFGIVAPINNIKNLGIPIIEDAAQSFLTKYLNKKNQDQADLTVLSFYPTKILNGIDGGCVLSSSEDLIETARSKVYYQNIVNDDGVIRYNFKLANVNAAVGLDSLAYLDSILERRTHLAQLLIESLQGQNRISVLTQKPQLEGYQKFILNFEDHGELKTFTRWMNGQGIPALKELIFLGKSGNESQYPEAMSLLNGHCSLPIYENLTDQEISYIVNQIQVYLKS